MEIVKESILNEPCWFVFDFAQQFASDFLSDFFSSWYHLLKCTWSVALPMKTRSVVQWPFFSSPRRHFNHPRAHNRYSCDVTTAPTYPPHDWLIKLFMYSNARLFAGHTIAASYDKPTQPFANPTMMHFELNHCCPISRHFTYVNKSIFIL